MASGEESFVAYHATLGVDNVDYTKLNDDFKAAWEAASTGTVPEKIGRAHV